MHQGLERFDGRNHRGRSSPFAQDGLSLARPRMTRASIWARRFGVFLGTQPPRTS